MLRSSFSIHAASFEILTGRLNFVIEREKKKGRVVVVTKIFQGEFYHQKSYGINAEIHLVSGTRNK